MTMSTTLITPGYDKPKSIAEQIAILRRDFSILCSADEQIATGTLPLNAEGWFAIPRWEALARTYGEALEKVLVKNGSKETGWFRLDNYLDGGLGPQYLRQHARTVVMFQELGNEQKDHDILIISAQFGSHHRGRSVLEAREVMGASEFGLGAFAVGIMLLTHPRRFPQRFPLQLGNNEKLCINCPGDEYRGKADGQFVGVPCFGITSRVNDDLTWLRWREIDRVDGYFGSASGFLSQ